MKIMHYFLGFPPFHNGGLMTYAKSLAEGQKSLKHDVIMIFPGKYTKGKKSQITFYKDYQGIKVYQITNPNLVSLNGILNTECIINYSMKNNYKEFLINEKIEILHVHSLIGFPKDLLIEAKELNIKTIFTVHDYFGICPKIQLFKYDGTLCNDYNNGYECIKCNKNADTIKKLKGVRNRKFLKSYNLLSKIKQKSKNFYIIKELKNRFLNNKMNKNETEINEINNLDLRYKHLREYYINIYNLFDYIIFNSELSKKVFSKYMNIEKNKFSIVPVTHKEIKDNRSQKKIHPENIKDLNLLYMGYLNEIKGFLKLKEVIDDLIEENKNNLKLHIYGNDAGVNKDDFNTEYYKFYGKYNRNDLDKIFKDADALIFPSRWYETFGFVALEAFSFGVPVIIGDNIGFSYHIKNGENGIIYKYDYNFNNLKIVLENILDKPYLLRNIMVKTKKSPFNFEYQAHLKQIMKIYNVK
jgi:glycosyltransferase involved in cell wall biosynthesis